MPILCGFRALINKDKNTIVKKNYLPGRFSNSMMSTVMQMEEFVVQSLLYDFYGELLTEHQRRIYEEVVFNDFSASEVAKEEGISRQGVHDMIKRCGRLLEGYEAKLHLVEKFLHIRENVRQIQTLTAAEQESGSLEQRMEQIRNISSDILEEL